MKSFFPFIPSFSAEHRADPRNRHIEAADGPTAQRTRWRPARRTDDQQKPGVCSDDCQRGAAPADGEGNDNIIVVVFLDSACFLNRIFATFQNQELATINNNLQEEVQGKNCPSWWCVCGINFYSFQPILFLFCRERTENWSIGRRNQHAQLTGKIFFKPVK